MENVILIAYVTLSFLVILAGLRWIIAIARLTIRLAIGLVKIFVSVAMFQMGFLMKVLKV